MMMPMMMLMMVRARQAIGGRRAVRHRSQVYQMGTRARKKWKQLDTDRSGALQGDEMKLLAEWVWCSFHSDAEASAEVKGGRGARVGEGVMVGGWRNRGNVV